jgi:hypothetical protein
MANYPVQGRASSYRWGSNRNARAELLQRSEKQ